MKSRQSHSQAYDSEYYFHNDIFKASQVISEWKAYKWKPAGTRPEDVSVWTNESPNPKTFWKKWNILLAPKNDRDYTKHSVFPCCCLGRSISPQRTKRLQAFVLQSIPEGSKANAFTFFSCFTYEEKRFVNGKHVRLNFCCSLELHSVYLFASLQ